MTISSLEFASGAVVPLRTLSFSGATALVAGPGVVHYFDVPLDNVTGATHLLTALCTAYEGAASPPDVAMPVWAPTPLGAAGVPRVLSFNEIALDTVDAKDDAGGLGSPRPPPAGTPPPPPGGNSFSRVL